MLEDVAERIRQCKRCPLHRARKNAVPGEGPPSPLALVGEAPGRLEDELGRPFVGPAGRLLRSRLLSLGLEAFITNAVRCRPPGNRRPSEAELYACFPHLEAELSEVRPRIIVALGETAGKALHRLAGLRWRGLSSARGKVVRVSLPWGEVELLFTYHPAAALRSRRLREAFDEDLRRLASLVSSKGSDVKEGRDHEAYDEGGNRGQGD